MIQRLICILFLLLPAAVVHAGFQFDTPDAVFKDSPLAGASTPCLRDDQLEMFFESSGDLYQALREAPYLQFQSYTRNTELSTTTYLEERPFLSNDGLRLYFTRRLSSSKVREIFVATREGTSTKFGAPVSIGPQGTSSFEGYLGSLTGDEKKVYLEVIRKVPSGSGTTLTEQTDIAYATRENTTDKFGAWTFVPGINTLDYERDPFITRDDTLLLFSRLGPLSKLPGTILYSLRENVESPFSTPAGVLGVNSANVVSDDPFLIDPGSRLYFRKAGEVMVADRILAATYSLPVVMGVPGWTFHYPIQVATLEEDAQQFDFRLYFDSIYLTWLGAAVAPGLEQEALAVTVEGSGRLLVSLRTSQPIPNTGLAQPVLYLSFKTGTNGVAGQKRTFRMSTGPQVNGVKVDRPSDGSIQFLAKPAYPPSTFWRVW